MVPSSCLVETRYIMNRRFLRILDSFNHLSQHSTKHMLLLNRVLISSRTCAQTLKVWIRTFIVLDLFSRPFFSVRAPDRSPFDPVTGPICYFLYLFQKYYKSDIDIHTMKPVSKSPDGQINIMNTVNVAWSQYQVVFMAGLLKTD